MSQETINLQSPAAAAPPSVSAESSAHDRDMLEALRIKQEPMAPPIAGTRNSASSKTSLDATYYAVDVFHQRDDTVAPHAETPPPPTQAGGKQVRAEFTARMLMERSDIGPGRELPPRAAMEGGHFASWDVIAEAMTERSKFDQLFVFLEKAQGDSVFSVASSYDWKTKATGQVFVAPQLHGGKVFSPALFSIYLFRKDTESKFSLFVIVSANSKGSPTTPYVGLIGDGDEMYESKTGFPFTPLSKSDNLLNYRFILVNEAPLKFKLRITTAYTEHPDQPYLTVIPTFTPIVKDEKVDHFLTSRLTKATNMVREATLMRDLISAYYPNSNQAELWKRVGALREGKGILAYLQATGLSIAARLLARNIWLKRPVVDTPAQAQSSER